MQTVFFTRSQRTSLHPSRPPVHGSERSCADALDDVARAQDAAGGFLELRVFVEFIIDAVRAEECRKTDLTERLSCTVFLEPDAFVLRGAVRACALWESFHRFFEREFHEQLVRAFDEQDIA